MAARRLLIIMVVLLTISTLAAVLVPPPEERGETTSTTSSSTAPRATGGQFVEAEVSAQDPRREPIKVEPGDQLSLVVTSRAPGETNVPAFGLLEFAGPGSPARFDLLIEKRGEFPVRFHGAGTIATIVADDREPNGSAGQS